MLRLHFNENPYGLCPELMSVALQEARDLDLQFYPDQEAPGLRRALADYAGVSGEQLMISNGSDDMIQLLFLAHMHDVERVVIPVPTFGMYRVLAEVLGLEVVEIPLTEDFELDVAGLTRAIGQSPSAVVLCHPNNPTGNYFSPDDIETICATDARLIAVDEAYYEFGGHTMVDAVSRDPRLVVIRTLSKAFGVAALRIGYLVGHPDKVAEIDAVRQPFNLSAVSQAMACAVVRNADMQLETVDELLRGREIMRRDLEDIPGLTTLPSEANFFLVRVDEGLFGMDAGQIAAALKERGILIRHFPDLPEFLRVTVGLPEQADTLRDALGDLCRQVD